MTTIIAIASFVMGVISTYIILGIAAAKAYNKGYADAKAE